jgi:hypothetical protein
MYSMMYVMMWHKKTHKNGIIIAFYKGVGAIPLLYYARYIDMFTVLLIILVLFNCLHKKEEGK